jgi:hypothetical protein
MKKLMLTCGIEANETGPRRELFELAESTFKPYAAKWGYDYKAAWYDTINASKWPGLIEGRTPLWRGHEPRTSPCWLKIPAIAEALHEYDFVLYLDHDCVVLDDSEDVFPILEKGKWLAMLDSFIGGPCVGFVLTRRNDWSQAFWSNAWFINAWETATWTDNGQILSLLGYTTTAPAIWLHPTPYSEGFQRLPEPWGGVGAPYGGKPYPCARIYHIAYRGDPAWKLSVMKGALEKWRTK